MNRNLRMIAMLAVLAFAASACGGSAPEEQRTTGQYGAGLDTDVEQKTKKVAQATPQAGSARTTAQQAPAHKKSSSSGTGFTPDLSRKPTDGGTAGGNAYFYLNKAVPKLVIEVDAVRGYEPTQAAMTLLNQRLTGVADKPGGIQILPVDRSVAPRDKWSMEDIKAAESKHRQTHNSLQQASIYLLYVNGAPSSPGPIGIAYSASSDVIFIEEVRGISTPIVGAEGIEKAVVIHEIGHLLALVNLGYKSPRNHEDPNSPGHSSNRESVMYYAVETVNVVALLGGNTDPPNAFDKDDLADLADLKSGKLS